MVCSVQRRTADIYLRSTGKQEGVLLYFRKTITQTTSVQWCQGWQKAKAVHNEARMILDVPRLSVIQPANDRFTATVAYWNYPFLGNSSRHCDNIAYELHKTVKTIAVQIKCRIFSGKCQVSVLPFLQKFKVASGADRIREGAGMWLLKQFWAVPIEAAVKTRVMFMNSANFYFEGALKSYFTIVQLLLKGYVTDRNVRKLDAEMSDLTKALMTPADYARELLTKTLNYEFVTDEKIP